MTAFKKLGLVIQIKFYEITRKLGIGLGYPLHYIGGSEALPPPLTSDEETYLLEKLSRSEYGVKSVLIERNLRLVVYIARKFENTGIGVEDLVSIGTIGLIKAVNTFNPAKNIKLATYASRCIENEILMYLRRNSRTKTEISIDEPLNVDWDGTNCCFPTYSGPKMISYIEALKMK